METIIHFNYCDLNMQIDIHLSDFWNEEKNIPRKKENKKE